jgi:2-haloalkanoic acid dehalogenase type II
VILSNVHRDGIAASNRKLGVRFDAIYTAEEIGSYKPSPRNFEYMLERLEADHGIAPNQILHTAQSLFHDIAPASDLGIPSIWINRRGEPADPRPAKTLPGVVHLADALDALVPE